MARGRSQPDSLSEVTGQLGVTVSVGGDHDGEAASLSVLGPKSLPPRRPRLHEVVHLALHWQFAACCGELRSLLRVDSDVDFGADISDAQVVALEGQAHTLRHGMHVYDSEAQLPVHLPVPRPQLPSW